MFPDWIRWISFRSGVFGTRFELVAFVFWMVLYALGWMFGLSLISIHVSDRGQGLWIWNMVISMVLFFYSIQMLVFIRDNLDYQTWTRDKLHLFLRSDHKMFLDPFGPIWYLKRSLDVGFISCFLWSSEISLDGNPGLEMTSSSTDQLSAMYLFQVVSFWISLISFLLCFCLTFLLFAKKLVSSSLLDPETTSLLPLSHSTIKSNPLV